MSARHDQFALNACFVGHGRVGGAEQFVVNLLEGIRAQVAGGESWLVYSREPLVTTFDVAPLQPRVLPQLPGVNRMAFESVALCRQPRPDVWLHMNYFTPPRLRAPSVTVVHDVQYEHYPRNFSAPKRAWLTLAHKETARHASKIVAISRHTADDLVRLHGKQVAARIEVVPNPVSFDRLFGPAELPSAVPTGRPYILGVAAHYRHKNLQTLIEAHAILVKDIDVALILVGQSRGRLAGKASATELDTASRLKDVVTTGFVADAVLGELYRHAAVFAFPSLFEGFGLPIVEALGMRVPTVTTHCAAIPEVGGSYPLYVDDPLSPDELAEALRTALTDPDSARPDEAAAEELRTRFSPATVAARYAEIVRSVA